MIGYDIDGVLAVNPPASPTKWGRMNGREREARRIELVEWYRNAEPILTPDEPFIAISARRDTPDVRLATEAWITAHQPNCVGVFLLPISRTVENVIAFKSAVIIAQELTDYTEDNRTILRGLHRAAVPARLWYYDRSMTDPVRYEAP